MNNIPTIEELDRIGFEAAGLHYQPADFGSIRYITAIRDAVVAACRPQLRPIADMPDTIPDGCVRLFWSARGLWFAEITSITTHYIDIALPTEDYPADFETAFAESGFFNKEKEAAFKLWKKGGER